jgi:rod shape determining protein RodA
MTMLQSPRTARSTGGSTDWWLVLACIGASVIGMVMIYTATRTGLAVNGLSGTYFVKRQAIFVFMGIVAMLILTLLDYRIFEQFATAIYIVMVGMLLMVLSPFGSHALGAQRWFSLGFVQIQPSEFALLSLILAVATYCSRRPEGLSLRDVSRLLLMAGFMMVLILVQPDLGTSIIMGITLLVMLTVAGLPGRILTLLLIGTVLLGTVVFAGGILSHYQILRITSFLHQNSSSPGLAQYIYNVNQAKTAIGAGGLFGTGIGHGGLTNLGYVPEQQTDFIFTAVGEQLGFVGSAAVLALLGFISWRVLRIAMQAKDVLGRLIAIGVFTFFTFSVFQNAGMTMGIMPVTGIPLPFFSYGGSSALVFFIAIGFALSVGARRGGVSGL